MPSEAPSRERKKKGPYAVIECPEKIPCDPCVGACPQGAISIPGSMIELPEIDYEKCTGCLICIPRCPGLAIFVAKIEGDKVLITLPYEFLPVPKAGDIVTALDREGKPRGTAKIIKVNRSGKTTVVTIEVDKKLAMEVRNIKLD